MTVEDTILIKINNSYVEGMSTDELYNATSISWVIAQKKLEEGNIKYFCAVYNNLIQEVYELESFERDTNEGKEARFILHGKVASDELRNRLNNLGVHNIHKGTGNPIKYTSMDTLLNLQHEDESSIENGVETKQEVNDIFISDEMQLKIVNLLKYKKNIILQGSPGVGKTYIAEKLIKNAFNVTDEQLLQVQFHQSISYEDFVEGYRPNEEGKFKLQNGLFKQFVKDSLQNDKENYFVIIDEINRGNLSKIFGELFMLIENDKRGKNIKLAYSQEDFTVPTNIYFVGTMNTADRSLANLDFALRRRFSFVHIEPAFTGESLNKFVTFLSNEGISERNIKRIVKNINIINQEIRSDYRLGKGFEIGHAYFTNVKGVHDINEWYNNIVEYELVPLIEEYYFDDEIKCKELIEVLRSGSFEI
ncbi:AAA family ATPase [Bacillus toyonensis]|uniref:AAA family ATPase n=1 Tax=Bacillus toyonensis TaxID=155322 RepID=UPI000BEDADE7|nr:AAA family ATPase [Bacillus toyonensis]PDZ86126.1 ATPase [Bacillus toyonensis]PEA71040.1 ATPase [Bacillus toyonensis]